MEEPQDLDEFPEEESEEEEGEWDDIGDGFGESRKVCATLCSRADCSLETASAFKTRVSLAQGWYPFSVHRVIRISRKHPKTAIFLQALGTLERSRDDTHKRIRQGNRLFCWYENNWKA